MSTSGEARRSGIDGAALTLGSLARRDVPLGPLTTYRVGGPAALMVHAESLDDVARWARRPPSTASRSSWSAGARTSSSPMQGSPAWPWCSASFAAAMSVEPCTGRRGRRRRRRGQPPGAGAPVRRRRAHRLEWAVGVPGSVGGGVRMNAGGHGSDVAGTLEGVRVFDLRSGEHGDVAASALALRFRGSDLSEHQVVLSARFVSTTATGSARSGIWPRSSGGAVTTNLVARTPAPSS